MDRPHEIIDTQPAQTRFQLKARVIGAGFPTYSSFAEKIGIHRVSLSKILNGHEWPSPNVQRKMAEELALSIQELRSLL